MLAHIHPSPLRFTCGTRPYLMVAVIPAQSPGPAKARQVPRAPSHAPGVTRVRRCVARCVGGIYPTFVARTSPCARPNPSRRLRFPYTAGLCRLSPVPAGRWPFPALSLQSLYGCLDPYPAAPLRCTHPFLPEGHRPHLTPNRFGAPDNRRNATSTTGAFRGCSHSVMFRLPYSLDPQVAPTAQTTIAQGQPGRLHHAMDPRLPAGTVVSLRA